MNHKEVRDHFAFHAPAMPADFERRGRKVERVIADGPGRKRVAHVQEWETPAQHHARWAYEYADAMLALRGEA